MAKGGGIENMLNEFQAKKLYEECLDDSYTLDHGYTGYARNT